MERKVDVQHANLALANLKESDTNPRRHFDKGYIAELAASVKEKGVLSPLLVRPLNGGPGYEIIAGACRFRASIEAGVQVVPCIIRRDLSDRDVVEIQIIENCQRRDLHPLEEGEGYVKLHKLHGLAVEELAAKVGKSKAYVYSRMKLAEMPEKSKDLFWAGKLDASRALLVARIPNRELAEKAADEIVKGRKWGIDQGEGMSYRDALEHIEQHYMLELKGATFDTKDATLCPSAGACTVCPKRTGNQKDLFPDVKRGDVCTDPACFRQKQDAEWKRRAANAAEEGVQVLEKPVGYTLPRGMVDLEKQNYSDPKSRTWREILGKDCPTITLARDEHGAVKELVRESDALEAAKKKGLAWAQGRGDAGNSWKKADELRKKKDALLREARRRGIAEFAPRLALEAPKDLLRVIVEERLDSSQDELTARFYERRQVENADELAKKIPAMSFGELNGLQVEIELELVGSDAWESKPALLDQAFRYFKVDLKAIEGQIKAEAKAAEKEKKKAKGKKPVPEPEKKKTFAACRGCNKTMDVLIAPGGNVTCAKCGERRCLTCGCTHNSPCPEGCAWDRDDHSRCSTCIVVPASKGSKKAKAVARS